MLENLSVMKNATEVDGGRVGWGPWCGAAVPTNNNGNCCVGVGATFYNGRTQITIAAKGVGGGMRRGIRNVIAGRCATQKFYRKSSKTISKNLEINFGRFREILHTFSKSLSENVDN